MKNALRNILQGICGGGLVIFVMILSSNSLYGQFYNGSQLTFGKNRVQYNDFLWTYYQFDDFDTYFYLNGLELALFTARYADIYLDELESRLETPLEEKIQFIIYNNLSDLKQSNIGLLSDQHYNTGGITYIIGHKVFVYFNGDLNHFAAQIRAGIARVIIEQTLYGGSVGTQIKNTTLMALPEWFVDGVVSYVSENWSSDIDNFVRDGIVSGRFEKFNHLTGEDAVYAGHAIWNFIAEKYGRVVIPNIIYMSKISRNVESGFLYVLGVSYKNLLRDCYQYYVIRYTDSDRNSTLPESDPLIKRPKKDVVYNHMRLSPDGRYIAYSSNKMGKYKLWLHDLYTGKKKKISKGGYKLQEKTDYSYPLIAWHPNGNIIAYIVESKGFNRLYFYDIQRKKKVKQTLYNFEKIVDFTYSPDGSLFLFSAVQKGQSDLYLYYLASNSFERLTNDIYNDLHPRFVENGSKIIFSSNRPDDTLRYDEGIDIAAMRMYNDVYTLDLTGETRKLNRITETPGVNEIYPMEYDNGYYSYLSDENGIYNRFLARFDSTIAYIDTTTHYRYFTESFPVTNYSRGIMEHDINAESGKYAEIIYKDERYSIFVDDLEIPENIEPEKLQNTAYADMKTTQLDEQPEEGVLPAYKTKGTRKKRFSNVHYYDQDTEESDEVDITNYEFNKQAFIQLNIEERPLQVTDSAGRVSKQESYAGYEFKIPKRRNYNVQFSINELISQIDFSYLNYTYQAFTGGGSPIFQTPGFNAFFKVGITDLLEDYRITGGVRLSVDLKNNEYLLSFANLKSRIDKEIVFHRKVFEEVGLYSLIKHYAHELHYMVKYPFNPIFSVRGTLTLRNDRAVYLSTDQTNLEAPDQNDYWGVAKGEIVYDNTRNLGINLFSGLRFKVFGEYYHLLEEGNNNVIILGADFRHYLQIHRTLIWANRFAGSTSFGTQKLIYYMGGVDNWISPKFNQETSIDYSQDYVFQTLATNLRGFRQNIRNGNSFAVFNTELRFPVFRYFANRPLKSDFLNNFQIVGFGDIGTAWTGLNPYSKENSLFTSTVTRPPLNITVEIQKEPLVGGYGFGVRSRIFGYFVRADLAWGVEDWEVLPAQFYFSLSLDF